MRSRTISMWSLRIAAAVLFLLPDVATRAAEVDDETYGPPPPPKDRKYPAAVCAEPTFNFGTAFEGDSVRHSYVIENRGKAPLIIERVSAGCKCTVAEFDKEIAEGATGHVTLVLDTKGLSGRVPKSATVFTNDPRKRQFVINIEGDVKQLLRFEPRTPTINVIKGSGKATTDVKIFAGVDIPIEITEAKAQSPDIETTIETVEAGKSFVLHISVDTNGARTYRYETVTIKAKAGDRDASTSISVTIRLKNPIEFDGSRPYVNFFKKDVEAWQSGQTPSLKKSANLVSVENKPFEVTGVDVKEPWVKASYEKVGDGTKWTITVELLSKPQVLASTVGRTVVTVHTNHPSVPTVDLNVMATF